ncbi:hypothetical protein [Bacillus sp. Bva_UNVM-123]
MNIETEILNNEVLKRVKNLLETQTIKGIEKFGDWLRSGKMFFY